MDEQRVVIFPSIITNIYNRIDIDANKKKKKKKEEELISIK